MDKTTHELVRLAADMRDDIARSEHLGKPTIGLWALMAYADRLERLVEVKEASHDSD